MHQVREGITRDQYVETMKAFHQTMEEESAKLQREWETNEYEILSRSTESLNGMLQQYLQTPLQPDKQEIRKIIHEALAKCRDQVSLPIQYGLSASWEGEVVFLATQNALLKRMMKSGREYLVEQGFEAAKGERSIFESLFVVQSGINLDILEHLVRDRIGVYSPVHGKHIREFDAITFSSYNLVFSYGTEAMKLLDKEVTEAAVFFSKPHMQYGPFIEGITEALEKMISVLKTSYITLWQRKLGLGRGREYVLRIYLRGRDAQLEESNRLLSEAIRWLSSYKEVGFVRETLVEGGSLLIKQMVK